MHVLGHSFSQRRKSCKRPRDLHIRKVSFSGSSLSSGCSSSLGSASTTTSSTYTARGIRPGSAGQAPPRLFDRPFIHAVDPSPSTTLYADTPTSFYDDTEDDDEEEEAETGEGYNEDVREIDIFAQQPLEMELPPHTSTPDHNTNHEREAASQDYFRLQLAKRPPLPRSHWSVSTVQSLDDDLTPGGSVMSLDTPATPTYTYGEDSDGATPQVLLASVAAAPATIGLALGYAETPTVVTTTTTTKAMTGAEGSITPPPTPKRPPFKAGDTVENFIKRGGWKRKGVVFNQKEVTASDDEEDEEEEVPSLAG